MKSQTDQAIEQLTGKVAQNQPFELLTTKLVTWYEAAITLLPNLVLALVILALFIIVAKASRKFGSWALRKSSLTPVLTNLILTITYLTILVLGVFTSLEILHLDKTVTSLLAGAGVIGLALGFAFQEIASNFISGFFIATNQPYKMGDIVEIDGTLGEVTSIKLRTTSITTFQGLEKIMPNKLMFTSPFINYTTTPKRRLDIEVGVSYADDLEKVEEVTKKALEDTPERLSSREVEVYFSEFGASSINLSARVWVKYPGHQSYLKARHRAVINIKKAFDKNNISIPFPIRTLDFGIRGGEELREHIPQEAMEQWSNGAMEQ
jgi:small conductance mechanosensitive channel